MARTPAATEKRPRKAGATPIESVAGDQPERPPHKRSGTSTRWKVPHGSIELAAAMERTRVEQLTLAVKLLPVEEVDRNWDGSISHAQMLEVFSTNILADKPASVLQAIRWCWNFRIAPPPILVAALANAADRYLSFERATLDEAMASSRKNALRRGKSRSKLLDKHKRHQIMSGVYLDVERHYGLHKARGINVAFANVASVWNISPAQAKALYYQMKNALRSSD